MMFCSNPPRSAAWSTWLFATRCVEFKYSFGEENVNEWYNWRSGISFVSQPLSLSLACPCARRCIRWLPCPAGYRLWNIGSRSTWENHRLTRVWCRDIAELNFHEWFIYRTQVDTKGDATLPYGMEKLFNNAIIKFVHQFAKLLNRLSIFLPIEWGVQS